MCTGKDFMDVSGNVLVVLLMGVFADAFIDNTLHLLLLLTKRRYLPGTNEGTHKNFNACYC